MASRTQSDQKLRVSEPHAVPPIVDLPGEAPYAELKRANSELLHEEIRGQATIYKALPEVVTLNHTDICNLRCIMCPRHLAQGTHRLDQAVLAHLAHQLFPTAQKLVLTTAGGEPLGADFDFLLELALQYGVKVDVVTNGVLLTPKLYRRARPALDHINVSVDTYDVETYERVREGASHERVFGNLRDIAALRQEEPDDVLFSLSAVVMRSTLPHVAELVRFAGEVGIEGVILQPLIHEIKPTPQEIIEGAFTSAEIDAALEAACAEAEAGGVNLLMGQIGRPNVICSPIRPKVPALVEGHGTCWFVAQNFGVMYTGEVYPCCMPTDHMVGNVLYEDPLDIWNGPALQRLRAAQISGRGTTFCSGCAHAPNLAPRKPVAVNRMARRVRMAVAHVKNKAVRRYRSRHHEWIFQPSVPDVAHVADAFEIDLDRTKRWKTSLRAEVKDGPYWVKSGTLYYSGQADSEPERLAELPGNGTASVIKDLGASQVLIAREEQGCLLRFDGRRIQKVLELSDERSFVRHGGIAIATDGSIWVGEYGTFPGARCARVYRSVDNGHTFEFVRHFVEARHVHFVYGLENGGVIVTTGDIAHERRMYVAKQAGKRFVARRSAWAGFTAIAECGGVLHAGTDLSSGNGFVRFTDGIGSRPEFRALPTDCDGPVRQMLALDDNRMLAWSRVEDDASKYGNRHVAALFLSEDAGLNWSLIYKQYGRGDELPENFDLLSAESLRLITVMGTQTDILEIDD